MAAMLSCVASLPAKCEPLCRSAFGKLSSSGSSNICFKTGVMKCSNKTNSLSDIKEEVVRPPNTDKHYESSVWEGFNFISSSTSDLKADDGRLKGLKNEVKSILSFAANDPIQEIDLVDKIQRLGVAYHFEAEIEKILQQTYNADAHFFDKNVDHGHSDLYYISLWFRLLRQAGYYVSPGVFKRFQDQNGEFHANLTSDVEAMLSLYEASYLGINGEDIMDEAMNFTTNHLNSMVTTLSPPLATKVQNALKIPLQKSVERIQAIHYIPIYQYDKFWNKTLLEFAKLDFNVVQLLHQEEITELLRWWGHYNIKSKLPFDTKERLVEAYVINMGTSFEPQFSLGRIHLTKIWCILTVIDDAHDVYGNLHELGQLSEAIQRWEVADMNGLPDPMKVVFLEVVKLHKEIEADMIVRGHFIGVPYLKREIQIFTKGQFEETKMLFSKDLPTLEKWLSVALITAGLNPFLAAAVMHLEEYATKEVFDWIASKPKILTCYNSLCRLVDDIAGYKGEQIRGITASTVTCYMKDHGVSESQAIETLEKMITSLWKDMNQECLRPIPVPRRVLKTIFNIIRNINMFYHDGDWHTETDRAKGIVSSLLINHIPN